jgi:lipid A 3-O-deacylase
MVRLLVTALVFSVVFAPSPRAARQNSSVAEADYLRTRRRDRPIRYRPNWRFEFSNDVFLRSDNFFSAGTSVQKHGPRVDFWENAKGTPAFGRPLARAVLPVDATDRSFRETWGIGQVISTPSDIETSALLPNDIPYSALLAVTNGWTAFNDTKFTGFQWLLGVVGPAALGEQVQTAIHKATGSPEPQGWDNQLGNEPVVNFTYMWKRKLVNRKSFDLAVNAGGSLGNWFTLADGSIELRVGKNKPKGFLYIPDPIGRSMFYDAALRPDNAKRYTFYVSGVFRTTYMARMLILDGSTFEDSHGLESVRRPLIGQLILGVHYRRLKWGIHTNWWFTTDFIESGAGVQGDTVVDFGTITLEYRF